MQHDERRAQALGEINCLRRLLHCAFPFIYGSAREFVTVWRGYHHLDWQGTKVVQATEPNLARVEHLLDAGNQRQPDAMAQLDQIKPEFGFDFAQHFLSGRVSSGIPTCGKRNHRLTTCRTFLPNGILADRFNFGFRSRGNRPITNMTRGDAEDQESGDSIDY